MARIKIVESVVITPGSNNLERQVMEAFKGDLPEVIYPEIRAISASRLTRNKTFYPSESLIGDKEKGTGINSILFPYPIPIIKDHSTGAGPFGGEASPVYGRAKFARFVPSESGGYVSVIPAITDEHAINMILTERFLTVSIGVETESVLCSLCNSDLTSEDACDHKKGKTYFVDGRPMEAFWKIGPVWFQEISFVTVPSDVDARIINKNVQVENLNIFAGESKKYGEIILQEHATDFNTLKRMWSIPMKTNETTQPTTTTETTETKVKAVTGGKVALAVIRDEKYGVEYPLFTVGKKTVNAVHTAVEASNFPEEVKNQIFSKLARYCEDKKVSVPESLSESAASDEKPVTIKLDESNYPLLFSLIEAMQQHTSELTAEIKSLSDKLETPKTTEENTSEAEITALTEQISVLNEKCLETLGIAHIRLAREVALLSKVLRKPVTRNSTVEEAAKELTKRTTASLEDTLSDLYLEFDGDSHVSVQEVEKVSNPTIKTDETVTQLKVDETTGKTTVDAEVTETEDDTLFVHFGLDPKALEKRLNSMKSIASLAK